jgi:hypothetical protein
MSKNILLIALLTIGSLLAGDSSCAQSIGTKKQDNLLAQRQLDTVKIETQSIGQLFSDLSLSHNIPIAVEIALNDDESAIYRLNGIKTTLSHLLTAFVTEHPEYSWQIKDGVVKVFPNEDHRDVLLEKLLAVRVRSFAVAKDTSCSALAESLIATPEVRRLLDANRVSYRERNFTGFYFPQIGRTFSLKASNTTVESILNRVIRESPSARFWLVTRNSDDHTVLLTLNARLEAVFLNSAR